MGRYLLDTNILIFLISGELDNISSDFRAAMKDYNNQLYISSVSVTELLQLYRIGKISPKSVKKATEIIDKLENELYVEILPFTKDHTKTLSKLHIPERHNDPFDHAIISHAITEKLTFISSDRKFGDYTPQKLNFVFNNRR